MNLKDDLKKPVFKKIGAVADAMEREVYVVGGYVRDIFLERTSSDIDFVTVGSGIELAKSSLPEFPAPICRYSPIMAPHR